MEIQSPKRMIDFTYRELQELAEKPLLAVIPIGSVEQHGLHAPLGTDLMLAEATAGSIERERVVILPSIPVGVSEYHRDFFGTLWVPPEVLKSYVGSILKSLKFHGINHVLIINGHGGNREPLREMTRYLQLEGEFHIYIWTWYDAIDAEIRQLYGYRPPLHADEAESSMLLAVNEQAIRKDQLKASAEGSGEIWGVIFNGTLISQVVSDFSKTGATGDPTKTNLEHGNMMLDWSVENLRSLIEYIFSRMPA